MIDNVEIVEQLRGSGRLPLRPAVFLERPPERRAIAPDPARVKAMMLGLAVGDALGNPTEGRTAEDRAKAGGEIRDYRMHPVYGDWRGHPSDDTQLAFWTLEQSVTDGALVPERLMRIFASRPISGIGQTVRQAIRRFHSGVPALECGGRSAGNGALMRIAPVLIPHLQNPSPGLWADTILATIITHSDSAAVASSLAFIEMLWRLLGLRCVPSPDWWWTSFCERIRELEDDTEYRPRIGNTARAQRLSEFIQICLPPALDSRRSIAEVAAAWGSGPYLLETVPAVLYILSRYGADPEEAIVRAVNDTWDNDTIGAIVGAAMGALHGGDALPERWITNLSGRTHPGDSSGLVATIDRALERFGPFTPR